MHSTHCYADYCIIHCLYRLGRELERTNKVWELKMAVMKKKSVKYDNTNVLLYLYSMAATMH